MLNVVIQEVAVSEQAGFLPENIETYIKIRGIYDGWSVAVMKDGRMLNRWPPDDRRHAPTQAWIAMKAEQDGGRK